MLPIWHSKCKVGCGGSQPTILAIGRKPDSALGSVGGMVFTGSCHIARQLGETRFQIDLLFARAPLRPFLNPGPRSIRLKPCEEVQGCWPFSLGRGTTSRRVFS